MMRVDVCVLTYLLKKKKSNLKPDSLEASTS